MESITANTLLTTFTSLSIALIVFVLGYSAWKKQKQKELLSLECKNLYFLLSKLESRLADNKTTAFFLSDCHAQENKPDKAEQVSFELFFKNYQEKIETEEDIKTSTKKYIAYQNELKIKEEEFYNHCNSINYQFELCSTFIKCKRLDEHKKQILEIIKEDRSGSLEHIGDYSTKKAKLQAIHATKIALVEYIFFK